MKTLFMIGWRNLWRNKRRSLVVISSIALGIFAMIFAMGFMNGINNQMVENTIKTSLGHVAIHRKGFQDDMKLHLNFFPKKSILTALRKNSEVAAYTSRIKLQGMIRSAESSRGVMIVGIDPGREKRVSNIYNYTSKKEGSRFLRNAGENSILISRSNADKLELSVGDKMVVMFQDRENEIIGVGLTIAGIFQTPIDTFDKFIVFMGIDRLREITGLGENISEINIILKDKKNVDSVQTDLISATGDPTLEILSWKDMAPNLVSAIKLFDNMMYIFFMIIFLTVVFSVANTLVMAIMERFHEIGVMKSIGTRPLWIFSMVLIEAVCLGLVGLAAGLAAGIGFNELLAVNGMDFSIYAESMRVWGTGMVIYPSIKTLDIIVATSIVMITTILAALYPAVKAARIKPLDALHYI